jgi:SET domain-containing protein
LSIDLRIKNQQLKAIVYADESAIHGTGVFATRDIAAGEYIGTYGGPDACRNGTYVLWVTDEHGVERGRSGRNLLRFLNHAAQANAEFDGYDLYARVEIPANAEVTFDYGEHYFADAD